MNTRHLVDPQLTAMLDAFPVLNLSAQTLPQVREEMAQLQLAPPHESGNVTTAEHQLPGPAGAPEVRVLVTRPTQASQEALPALVWIHGGGYVLGSADQNQPLLEALAEELGCVTVSVDYRLAPETPHPGPVEDCYAALEWTHQKAGDLGIDADRIVIGGESAGGGLAAALALLARDRAKVPMRAQMLIYPMIDDRTCTNPDLNPYVGEFVWTNRDNAFGWASLLGHEPGRDGVSPYAAAARADDLAGLPPTFIGVGSLDLFLDENITYAQRLLRAGVPAELHIHPGAFHGYFGFEGIELGERLRREFVTALRNAFTR
ncbi:alpha/beta hydrolase [Salinactinospora qingdaonensis]|uniref:Alpha/beta hydrolase n=1 Tax=Salinactinospora qingdaonensis TaxID=702744 RepID=A0ABP7FW48_9ACTN